jgi:hypothetical protein
MRAACSERGSIPVQRPFLTTLPTTGLAALLVVLPTPFGGTAAAQQAEPAPRAGHRPWVKTPAGRARDSGGWEAQSDPAGSEQSPARTREGFFARLSLGSGWFTASSGASEDRRTFYGAPVSLEMYLGGTTEPWLGLAGGYCRDDILGLSSEDEVVDGDEPDLDSIGFSLESISLLATLYPGPTSPFYGFVTLGLGVLDVQADDDDFLPPLLGMFGRLGGSDPAGFVMSLGGGYDWWLNERWTAGVSGRLLYAPLSTEEAGSTEKVIVLMPSVLFTLGYH